VCKQLPFASLGFVKKPLPRHSAGLFLWVFV